MAEQETAEVLTQDVAETQVNPEATATAEATKLAGDTADPQGTQKQAEQDKKRPGGWLRKLNRAEQERDYWREQALRNQPQTVKTETTAKDDDPEPKEADFKEFSDYLKALTRWNARQEFKTMSASEREKATKDEEAEYAQEIAEQYRSRLDKFAEEHDDFREVVGEMKLLQRIMPAVENAIMEDENGPAVAYYLGQHPEEVEKINGMSMNGAARYIGRLSERLFPEQTEETEEQDTAQEESETAPKPKQEVQAPKTIKPVKKPAPTATGLRDDEPIDKWMAKRNKETSGR